VTEKFKKALIVIATMGQKYGFLIENLFLQNWKISINFVILFCKVNFFGAQN
jgi:hypothetical protein